MSKWLNRFLEKDPQNRSDKGDNCNLKPDLSLLSPPSTSTFRKNLGNIPGLSSDKSDNNDPKPDLSLLSLPSMGVFEKNLGNIPFANEESVA